MNQQKKRPMIKIQQEILRTLMALVVAMTILIATISIYIDVRSENHRLDQNLQNIAQSVAHSQVIHHNSNSGAGADFESYLDSLQQTLSNIDVISVVDADMNRLYHTNKTLIGTKYDGTTPDFKKNKNFYVTGDIGPSGPQRRAYAAIYDENGTYCGFVMAVILNRNIYTIILRTITVHLCCAIAVIMLAIILSKHLSEKIKRLLLGYEPDTFSAMFSIRDNILDSLEEGIIAVEENETIIYMNQAAKKMLHIENEETLSYKPDKITEAFHLKRTISTGEKMFGLSLSSDNCADILADTMPVMEQEQIVGALCILRDRTEYTHLMEELSGVRYMVESMRANSHDFTNKLHVILGLIQIGKTDEACEYITHITAIQQKVLHNIMRNIEVPSIAALLIGKYARAAELNIRFCLETGSHMGANDLAIPSGDLVTIIGNLLDNAMDAMNHSQVPNCELTIGIFTQPHALLLHVDDTGIGMTEKISDQIFTNGFSTKGEQRGTGLYIVNNLIRRYGGTITVDSEPGTGTSFTVTLTDSEKKHDSKRR